MRYRIFGSCVTRDAFERSRDPKVSIEKYFARSSIASALAPARFDGIDTTTIPSPFQRRIVEWDFNKEFASTLRGGAFDYVVIDLIDERFDLLRNVKGALATRSNELLSASPRVEGHERLGSGTPEFMQLWAAGWRRLIELVDATVGREAVLLHRARWAERTETGAKFRGQTSTSIGQANAFLDNLHSVVEEDLPARQIISVPSDLVVGADEHRWGPSPFHYVDEYYANFMRMLTDGRGRKP